MTGDQLALDYAGPRARRADPAPSHSAAAAAARFANSHAGRIVLAVLANPGRTAVELAALPGLRLTTVQIDRRAHELEREGWITRSADLAVRRLFPTLRARDWAEESA